MSLAETANIAGVLLRADTLAAFGVSCLAGGVIGETAEAISRHGLRSVALSWITFPGTFVGAFWRMWNAP